MRAEVGMSGKLGVIAGGGQLPRRLAEHVHGTGRGVFVLGIKGFADSELTTEYGGAEIGIGEINKAIRLFKYAGCEELVFAGTVRRPDFSSLKTDLRGAWILARFALGRGRGDDALLRLVLSAFEREGFRVVGADDVLSELLAPAGPMGKHAPSADDWADIRSAALAAGEIGAQDVGQGAIARNGSVVATESEDGTDAMLGRVASTAGSGGVLVKRPKPQQERRIDLPTIGVDTVRGAHAARLRGIAVEAGGALVMDREKLVEEANRLDLFVYGLSRGELS